MELTYSHNEYFEDNIEKADKYITLECAKNELNKFDKDWQEKCAIYEVNEIIEREFNKV